MNFNIKDLHLQKCIYSYFGKEIEGMIYVENNLPKGVFVLQNEISGANPYGNDWKKYKYKYTWWLSQIKSMEDLKLNNITLLNNNKSEKIYEIW